MIYTDKYIYDEMNKYTEIIKNTVKGMMVIWNSGDKASIAKMHYINDTCLNNIERVLYGDTLKNLYNKQKRLSYK